MDRNRKKSELSSDGYPPLIFRLLFVVGFFVLWYGVHYYLEGVSGWRKLATRFPMKENSRAETRLVFVACMGWVPYGIWMKVGFSDTHIYLRLMWYAFFHKPLMIPWSSISKVTPVLYFPYGKFYELEIEDPILTTLRLKKNLLERSRTFRELLERSSNAHTKPRFTLFPGSRTKSH